jgi:DNA-binding transcriptional regulator/RsmH inhibitor MraZ
LMFFDEKKSLDEKNRIVLPSKIINLLHWNQEILSLKIYEPYQHIVLLPYHDELKKIISWLDMSYSNALVKNPISSIKIDATHRIIMPQECLKQWDKVIQIIWEKYWIRIFSDSIYKNFCEQ